MRCCIPRYDLRMHSPFEIRNLRQVPRGSSAPAATITPGPNREQLSTSSAGWRGRACLCSLCIYVCVCVDARLRLTRDSSAVTVAVSSSNMSSIAGTPPLRFVIVTDHSVGTLFHDKGWCCCCSCCCSGSGFWCCWII